MNPIKTGKLIIEEQVGSFESVCIFCYLAKYMVPLTWRYHTAATVDGRVILCRFLVEESLLLFRWKIVLFEKHELPDEAGSIFEALKLTDAFARIAQLRSVGNWFSRDIVICIDTPEFKRSWSFRRGVSASVPMDDINGFMFKFRKALNSHFGGQPWP